METMTQEVERRQATDYRDRLDRMVAALLLWAGPRAIEGDRLVTDAAYLLMCIDKYIVEKNS